MKVLISGASGLIGTALVESLEARGGSVVRLVRAGSNGSGITWDPMAGTIDSEALVAAGIDAVIHLAGESVQGRWTEEKKRKILESRTHGTTALANAIAALPEDQRPRSFIVASAIGYYGDQGEADLHEDAAAGTGFLAGVVQAWEASTAPASDAGIRTVLMRTGIVQSPRGGALKEALTPFKLGVGGPFGAGKQWMSWVTLADVVGAYLFALDTPTLHGIANLTAPAPVRNRQWAKALGKVLKRPVLFPIPRPVLKMVLGEFSGELFASAKVLPTALLDAGYVFQHPEVEAGLRAELGR